MLNIRPMLLIKTLCLLFVISTYFLFSQPITTPIKWEGLDTLSKFYRAEKLKQNKIEKLNQLEKIERENCKIPFQKHREDEILGEPISDPRVVFSTYVGGNGYDCGNSVAYDSQENIYIVGYSGSTNMATTEGCFQKNKKGGHDAFIGKFTNKGKLIWMTYLGGNNTDVATDCIVDDLDNLIVVGKTDSPDFPFTEGTYHGSSDVFLTKFSPDGKILWAKSYGDTAFEAAQGIAKAENDNFVITGYTTSPGLPIKGETFQKSNNGNNDAFLAKFDNNGNLIWSTYFGGGCNDIGTGISCNRITGEIAICGYTFFGSSIEKISFPVTNAFQWDTAGGKDAFAALFDSTGWMIWSTIYGGIDLDKATGLTIDKDKNVKITGYSGSTDFPLTENAYQKKITGFDDFILIFNSEGNRIYSTFYGGNGTDESYSIDGDSDNNIWITGVTKSTDFPTTNNAIFKTIYSNQLPDIFFGRLTSDGFPSWVSCYQSVAGNDFSYKIKTMDKNKFIVTGESNGYLFPVTKNCFQENVGSWSYHGFLVFIDLLPSDVQEPNPQDDFTVYPNPAGDFLEISLSQPSEGWQPSEGYNVAVFNGFGTKIPPRLTSSATPQEGNLRLDVSSLPPGVYFVKVGEKVGKFVKI